MTQADKARLRLISTSRLRTAYGGKLLHDETQGMPISGKYVDWLEAQLAKTLWRSITSAPKDGTRILLGGSDMHAVIGHFNAVDQEWYDHDENYDFQPTHWMPLPEPPEVAI